MADQDAAAWMKGMADARTGIPPEGILTEEGKMEGIVTGTEPPIVGVETNHGWNPDPLSHIPVQPADAKNPEITMDATATTNR